MKNEYSSAGKTAEIATQFKALGDPTRLRIFSFLRSCCGPIALDEETGAARPVKGATVGEVCCTVTGEDRITSTLSHHLRELRLAGLIDVERSGKNMICRINREAVARLAAFLDDAPLEKKSNCGSACQPK